MVGVNYFTIFVSKTITTMFRWNAIRILCFYYKSRKSSYGSSFRTKHNLIYLCAINPFLNTFYYFFPCKLGYRMNTLKSPFPFYQIPIRGGGCANQPLNNWCKTFLNAKSIPILLKSNKRWRRCQSNQKLMM